MIAMQYIIPLPTDYDMSRITRRIADKGGMTDALPGLVFKAYLSARINDPKLPVPANRYAPVYLWREVEAMNAFLHGPMFQALVEAFGRPPVHLWSVRCAEIKPDLRRALYASCDITEIQALPCEASPGRNDAANVLAMVEAYNPTSWRGLRLQLWETPPPARLQRERYRIGHLSMPEANTQSAIK